MEINGKAMLPIFNHDKYASQHGSKLAQTEQMNSFDNASAKTWLQSQGILFSGATPKRECHDNKNSVAVAASVSPGMESDTNSDDDQPAFNQEPTATPPSRWQQMFKQAPTPSATTTTTSTSRTSAVLPSTSSPSQLLPPPPPSPSSFQTKQIRRTTPLANSLEWNQSTDDVNEWIARVKQHSDKIAEEMFERAGLSPPRTERELRFLSHATDSKTPLQDKHPHSHQEKRNYEGDEGEEDDEDDENEDEETAQEARDILSSWMEMDDEAREIRTTRTKQNKVREHRNADRRGEGVIRTQYTKRPVLFEESLRGNSSSVSGASSSLLHSRRQTKERSERNQRELDEERADKEAQEILSLAERMVLQPLHRDGEDKETTQGNKSRTGTKTTAARSRSDPRLMMEARQTAIREKRENRRMKQIEADKAFKNMTLTERRQHRAHTERTTRQQARERARSGRDENSENLRAREDRGTRNRKEVRSGRGRQRDDRHEDNCQHEGKRQHEGKQGENEARRAIVLARKEVRLQREERERAAKRLAKDKKREAVRLKLQQEKDHQEMQHKMELEAKKNRKRLNFIYEMIVARRRGASMKKVFECLHLNRRQEQKRKRQKAARLQKMKKEHYFHSWRTKATRTKEVRQERYKKAMVYCMFTLIAKCFQKWHVQITLAVNARKELQLERQLKQELRGRRMREMAASRLWRRRTLVHSFTTWTTMMITWKDERLNNSSKRKRKKNLMQLLSNQQQKIKVQQEELQEEKEEDQEDQEDQEQEEKTESKYEDQKFKRKSKSRRPPYSKNSSSHHLPSRLPHTQPQSKSKSVRTRDNINRRNKSTVRNRTGKRLPPMPPQPNSASVVDAMNERAEIHRQKREERRQRYLAADLHKQRYRAWKTIISTLIGPDAARAGRMFARRRSYLLLKKRKKEKAERVLRMQQQWAAAVIHDANTCVKLHGLDPWKKYVREQHIRRAEVERMRWTSIVSKCYATWKRNVHDVKRYGLIFTVACCSSVF